MCGGAISVVMRGLGGYFVVPVCFYIIEVIVVTVMLVPVFVLVCIAIGFASIIK